MGIQWNQSEFYRAPVRGSVPEWPDGFAIHNRAQGFSMSDSEGGI